jgi:hypothetical protein
VDDCASLANARVDECASGWISGKIFTIMILNSNTLLLCGVHNDFNGKSCSILGEDFLKSNLELNLRKHKWNATLQEVAWERSYGSFARIITQCKFHTWRSQWPLCLRRKSSAARLLRLLVRIPPGAWMSVCCEWRVLSGRGLWDGLITRPEESYRLWCVVVCDQETSKTRRVKPATGLWKYKHSGL